MSGLKLPISLEFFPPKTPEGTEKLRGVREKLYDLKPEFCSVTYGAGGSTQEGTFATVNAIQSEGVAAASHFSCIGASKASVRAELATLKAMGVKRLVALRGDLPSGYGAGGEFHYASDLVAFIRAETGDDFHIEVAAYPEIHPQAKSPEADLQAFATKVKGLVVVALRMQGGVHQQVGVMVLQGLALLGRFALDHRAAQHQVGHHHRRLRVVKGQHIGGVVLCGGNRG
jgi:methylenetetrahydrofolate reductase (NADPH)